MGRKRKNRNKKSKKNGETLMVKAAKAIGFRARQVTLPTSDEKELTTFSIPLFTQKTLNTIRDIGMPAAGASEYQVHYRGLQIIVESKNVEEDPRRLVFTIPTVFFNFSQTVTSVSVDFSLDEVAEISQKLIPVSDALIEKYMAAFPTEKFVEKGFEVSARELEMGSIHRHPSAFGFSATDLDNKADNPGVIFRNLECEDKIQVDSVMYIPSIHSNVQLVVTETRVVDVAPAEDGGIEGSYAKAATRVFIAQDVIDQTTFKDFFESGVTGEEAARKIEFITKSDEIDAKDVYPEIEEILSEFILKAEYDPQVIMSPDFISPRHGSTTYSSYSRYGRPGAGRSTTTTTTAATRSYWDEEYGMYIDEPVSVTGTVDHRGTTSSKDKDRGIYRPSWKKNQTLSALRIKGLPVDEIKEIDGSASDEDIYAIAEAMKAEAYTDAQIRTVFTQLSYPSDSMNIYYTKMAEKVAVTSEPEDNSVPVVHVTKED